MIVTIDGFVLRVGFGYNPDYILAIKEAPNGRRWNKETKTWDLPDTIDNRRFLRDTFHISELDAGLAEMERPLQASHHYEVDWRCDPFAHQVKALDIVLDNPAVALFHEMGLGKTLVAIKAIEWRIANGLIRNALIVCPKTVLSAWTKEFAKYSNIKPIILSGTKAQRTKALRLPSSPPGGRVFLVNYDLLSTMQGDLAALEIGMLILDESQYCFPFDTLIETEFGKQKIGEIVENKINQKVYSMNLQFNKIELKKIVRFYKFPLDRNLIKIFHESGELICTEDHQIFVEGKNYVEAKNIEYGNNLRVLRKNIFIKTSNQSDRFHSKRKVLFNKLFGKMENETTRNTYSNLYSTTAGKVLSGKSNSPQITSRKSKSFIGENEKEQSNVQTRIFGKDDRIHAREIFRNSQGERVHNGTTKNFTSSNSNGKFHGIHDSIERSKKYISKIANQLQSRYWNPFKKNCNRNRWSQSSNKKSASIGSKERASLESSGVENVEILELGYIKKSSIGITKNQYVYCLEVEENNNFFANNILVSNCKTYTSQRAKAAYALRRGVKYVLLLTGTPITRDPSDVFSQYRILDERIFGSSFYAFRNYYFENQGRYYPDWKIKPGKLDEIKAKMALRGQRLLKRDALDLPPKLYQTHTVEMEPEQRRIYREIRNQLMTEINEQTIAVTFLPTRLIRLNQICSGYLPDAAGHHLTFPHGKLRTLRQIVDDYDGKVVVFATFRHDVAAIEAEFQREHVAVIDGDVSLEVRATEIERFQTDPACRVIVLQTAAGGLGITLTAASLCVFYSQDYNFGNKVQAMDRLHRIGQVHAVTYVDLVCQDSIEEIILDVLEEKRLMAGYLQGDIADMVLERFKGRKT